MILYSLTNPVKSHLLSVLQIGDQVRLELGGPEMGALLLPAAAPAGAASSAVHLPPAAGEGRSAPASEAGAP